MNIAALLSPTVTALKGAASTAVGQPDTAFAALFAIGSPDGAVPAIADSPLQPLADPGAVLPAIASEPGVVTALPVADVPAPTARAEMAPEAQPVTVDVKPAIPAAPPEPAPALPPRLAAAMASTSLTPVVARAPQGKTQTDADDEPKPDDGKADDEAVPIEAASPIIALLAAIPVAPPPPPPAAVVPSPPAPVLTAPSGDSRRADTQPAAVMASAALPAAAPLVEPTIVTTVQPQPDARVSPAIVSTPPTSSVEIVQPAAPARITPAPREPQPAVAPLALAMPRPTDATPLTSGPALQVFGAAIAAAREPVRRDPTDAAAPITTTAAQAPTPIAVAAVGEAQQAPLDLSQQRWPHAMIERIEQVRDLADAADTRIRLIPDALGTVDVSVRQDGDRLHVHFTAAEPQTRALLVEAQPRLAAAAEERGLKLGGTAVDGGSAGQSQPQQQQQAQQQRAAQPSRAPQRASTTTSEPADDGRLA